jgi:hypothetical protein
VLSTVIYKQNFANTAEGDSDRYFWPPLSTAVGLTPMYFCMYVCISTYEGVSKSFRTESIKKYMHTTINTR